MVEEAPVDSSERIDTEEVDVGTYQEPETLNEHFGGRQPTMMPRNDSTYSINGLE